MKKGNKITKIFFLASSILLCTICTAGAEYIENINYNYKTERVEISGRDFSTSDESVATVIVLKGSEKQELSNLSEDNIEKQEQTVIQNGEFSFEFKLHAPTDGTVYTAYVTAGASKNISSFTYSDDAEGVYDEVIANLSAISAENSAALCLDDTVYGALSDKAAVGAIISQEEKDAITALAASDKLQAIELLKETIIKASYIQALNENKLSEVVTGTVFNDPELLGLESLNTTAYELYCSEIKDVGVTEILANIQGRGFTSVEDFLDTFTYEATVAAIAKNKSSGDGHIEAILKDNNARNKFDLSNYSGDVVISGINTLLLKNTNWAKDNVQKILNAEVLTESADPENNGGGGTSSGGGSPSVGKPSGGFTQDYSVGGLSKPTTTEKVEFTDLSSVEWAREAIEALAAKGVVSGRGDGTFAPNDNVTRAEFLTMILNAFGMNNAGATCNFTDVATGDWFYQAVAMGTTLGFAKGYDNGAFGAKDNITRQDAVVMLNNAVTKLGRTLVPMTDSIEFADSSDIAEYAQEAVDTFVQAGIVSGMEDGTFMPKNNCTRAQAAVMIYNLMVAVGMEG